MPNRAETLQAVRRIVRRIIANEIPVKWRSTSPIPGAGERKSFSRGSNGYDVVARG